METLGQPIVLEQLPQGPCVLRPLPKKTARPDPGRYLLKKSSLPLQTRKSAVAFHRKQWPMNLCPQPSPCFSKDMTDFAKLQRASQHTEFQRLYDLGLIDFVSVRWQCQEMVLLWRSPLSPAALQFYLPIFIAGSTNPQDPYHFLALRGALDMIHALGPALADVARQIAASLRALLLRQCPLRCADVCLLLSHICQESPSGASALKLHFWMLGPGLNRFVRCRRVCVFGQRATLPLCECVWHVLRQLDSCGGLAMRRVVQRHVPLYDAPVDTRSSGGNV